MAVAYHAPIVKIVKHSPHRLPLLVVLALAAGLGACDTGDGKTLPDPTGTLPPPTVPATSTELPLDGVGTLASLPIESIEPGVTRGPLPVAADSFTLTAPWPDGAPIEAVNTCDAGDLSPALSWSNVPDGTVELAVVMVDESVGDGTPLVHWVMGGINPDAISLIEGDSPDGSIRGVNFFGNLGYNGPCPPPGDSAHFYRTTMYALNQRVELADGTSATDLLGFVQNVAIASADVTGTFER